MGSLTMAFAGADIFFHATDEVSDRAHLRLSPVHVRRSPQCGEHIGLRHHLGREIAVQVQAGDDRYFIANRVAHAAYQVAFPVAQAFHLHRAVQVQVQRRPPEMPGADVPPFLLPWTRKRP